MDNSDNTKEKLINIILKNTTVIFALIIFLSFFQIYIFFQNFNIGVYNYNSSYELLLYFIPSYVIAPFKIFLQISNIHICSILGINIQIYTIISSLVVLGFVLLKIKTTNEFVISFNILCRNSLNYSKENIVINIIVWFMLVCVLFVSYFIFIILYKLISLNPFDEFEYYLINNFINVHGCYHNYFQFAFLVWGIFVFLLLYLYTIIARSEKLFRPSLFVLLFVTFIMFIFSTIKISYRVASLKDGKTLQHVSFEYDYKPVATDSNNFYIGQTKDYLFIRNIKERENKVYNLNNIKWLIVKDVDSSFSK
jgi:hypothetical protein